MKDRNKNPSARGGTTRLPLPGTGGQAKQSSSGTEPSGGLPRKFRLLAMTNAKGFTMVEILLVMAIFAVMTGLATVSLGNFQHQSQLNVVSNSLLTDLREQQAKAMVGDTEGTSVAANYGVRFSTTSYTLYRNSFGTSNFTVTLPSTLNVLIASASSEIVFLKGSGEIPGHASNSAVITLSDTVDGSQKVIQINRYGVITAVN